MRRQLWILPASLALAVVGCALQGAKPAASADDDFGPVADFSLTERGGRTVRLDDLRDKVWVAGFVFTRCTGPCSQVSGSMARLQKDLAGQKDVVLITFTVDPQHDNAEVLKKYAAGYGADPDRWLFLTGERDAVYRLIRTSFMLGVESASEPNKDPGNAVTHSTKLALVDRKGHIRGYFDGTDSVDVERLERKVTELLAEAP
jgi:protein SCO1/2